MSKRRACARCGATPPDGYARINSAWYCHPDDEDKPDCYSLAWLGFGFVEVPTP